MEILNQLFTNFKQLFIWWTVVTPWEQSMRVRTGKTITVLKAGLHFRIPYIDRIYTQPTRTQIITTPLQTIHTVVTPITISFNINYSIVNIMELYQSTSEPEQLITSLVQEQTTAVLKDFPSNTLERHILHLTSTEEINNTLSKQGLHINNLSIVTYTKADTYRLIQDNHWSHSSNVIDINQFN